MFKITVAFLAACAMCTPSFAETKKEAGYTFNLKASRDGSEYKKGETAEFILTATKDGKPVDGLKISGEITKDSVKIGKTFAGVVENGKFSVSGTLDESGFLKCAVFANVPGKDGKQKRVDLLAGAAFSPLEIKQSLPAPEDFDAFWAKQKEILAAIPMNVKLTPVKSGDASIAAFDVQADTFNGKLSAYLAYPKDAAPKSLPAVVSAHGAGVRGSNLGGAVLRAKKGFIALDFNAHGLPNGQPEKYYKDIFDNELKGYPVKDSDSRDTIFFRTLYMRLMRAMDVIMAQPQWNGKDLLVMGGSQGGGQALAAGGLYPDKVTFVAACYPAICDHSGAAIGRTNGWPHFTRLDAQGNYDKKKTEAARYIDAVNFAERIKGRVFFMINYADNVCEPTSCYSAYNSIKAPKKLFINEESRHKAAPGTVEKLYGQAYDAVKAQN